jgi:hypothetical protein
MEDELVVSSDSHLSDGEDQLLSDEAEVEIPITKARKTLSPSNVTSKKTVKKPQSTVAKTPTPRARSRQSHGSNNLDDGMQRYFLARAKAEEARVKAEEAKQIETRLRIAQRIMDDTSGNYSQPIREQAEKTLMEFLSGSTSST